jgi:hypothetical protein
MAPEETINTTTEKTATVATPPASAYAYSFPGPKVPDAKTENVTINNYQPLMLLWLFITTDPAYMNDASPEQNTALRFTYTDVAKKLNMSPEYLRHFFKWAHRFDEEFSVIRGLFAEFLVGAVYDPDGSMGSCVRCDRLLSLAPDADQGWGRTVPMRSESHDVEISEA